MDEVRAIQVQALFDRRGAELGARERDALGLCGDLFGGLALVAGVEPLDEGGLHAELDPVEREEPDDVLQAM